MTRLANYDDVTRQLFISNPLEREAILVSTAKTHPTRGQGVERGSREDERKKGVKGIRKEKVTQVLLLHLRLIQMFVIKRTLYMFFSEIRSFIPAQNQM